MKWWYMYNVIVVSKLTVRKTFSSETFTDSNLKSVKTMNDFPLTCFVLLVYAKAGGTNILIVRPHT